MMKNNTLTEGQKLVGLTLNTPEYKNLTIFSSDLIIRYKQACAVAIDILLKKKTEKEIKINLGTKSKYKSRLINFDAKKLIEILINTILKRNNGEELERSVILFDASIQYRGMGYITIPHYMMCEMIDYDLLIIELKEENQNPLDTVAIIYGAEYKLHQFILLGTLGNIALFLYMPVIKEELSYVQKAVGLSPPPSDDKWTDVYILFPLAIVVIEFILIVIEKEYGWTLLK